MPIRREPLAIVGVGCRFPGSHGPGELWQTLISGHDEVSDAPPYRARTRIASTLQSPPRGAEQRGSLGDVGAFDWRAFRISPREGKYIDPQQRLLLETTWEAIEDAGVPFEQIAGTRTAVFMGIMWPDYAKLIAENPAEIAGYATSGVGFALAANRVSYAFDLRGPSVSLDVQCASSVVSVCLAAASIWSGEAELALAGGVNLILAADSDAMMSRAGILSLAGRCRTFDAAADGFVRSEGAGVIMLKPLSRALADCDRVLASIRGTACNHDGHRAALTAPSQESQVELVRLACVNAGVGTDELDYVELHGTGTQKGDPLEAQALGAALQDGRVDDPCLVGSIKSNLGHCESAAGIASVIKVALALHHGVIPATINHTRTHPEIDARSLGIELVTEPRPWPERDRPSLAGVTGLSLGGGNAHVVVEQAPPVVATRRARIGTPAQEPIVLPISACSKPALCRLAGAYAAHLDALGENGAAIRATCAAAALRRTHHEHRAAVVGSTAAELAHELRSIAVPTRIGSPALPMCRIVRHVTLLLPRAAAAASGDPLQRRISEWGLDSTCTFAYESTEDAQSARDRGDLVLRVAPEAPTQELLALLYRAGCEVRWASVYGSGCAAVALPTYQWDRERLWIDPRPAEADARRRGDRPLAKAHYKEAR